jgi:hypothetical protein
MMTKKNPHQTPDHTPPQAHHRTRTSLFEFFVADWCVRGGRVCSLGQRKHALVWFEWTMMRQRTRILIMGNNDALDKDPARRTTI